ncbi:hypothetical protein VE01_10153 [Pseudogymnoascus verrucosus]|uniref:Uncharacterized protein n=1 Tax=Pseudogymnoascus verrucosus TaxID=342668 RepID=A0A1B8G7M9_9PEZI|nr:uncharacterized protein VE01_10153 [Pseudogymnoascus verrucosus]OBT91833.1 hypothetical protein VE01_10153 [Pseudogymnoascus verrucosus]
MALAKYSAIYKQEGILFLVLLLYLSLFFAWLQTNVHFVNEGHLKRLQVVGAKTISYAPHFKGPVSAEEAAKRVLDIVERSTLEDEKAATAISQTGTDKLM